MEDAAPFGTYAPTGLVRWAVQATRAFPDTWLTRKLVILLRRLAASRLKGAPVDIEALGARMRVLPYNNICEKRMLFNPQTFDPEELALLAARLTPGFTFIDVGANVGAYALFVASRIGSSGRVLAIEPQPVIFDRLVYNIRLNAPATIKAIACAIADRSGDVTLFVDQKNSGESSVKVVASSGATPMLVPARTLLDLLRDEGFERLDAIKLDVEGAEDLILEPFFADAPNSLHPQLLIVENAASQWHLDLPALLARHGYRQIAKTRLNLVFERSAADPTPSSRPEP